MNINKQNQLLATKVAYKDFFKKLGITVEEDDDILFTEPIRRDSHCEMKSYYLTINEIYDLLEVSITSFIDNLPIDRYVEICMAINKLNDFNLIKTRVKYNEEKNSCEIIEVFSFDLISRETDTIDSTMIERMINLAINKSENTEMKIKQLIENKISLEEI